MGTSLRLRRSLWVRAEHDIKRGSKFTPNIQITRCIGRAAGFDGDGICARREFPAKEAPLREEIASIPMVLKQERALISAADRKISIREPAKDVPAGTGEGFCRSLRWDRFDNVDGVSVAIPWNDCGDRDSTLGVTGYTMPKRKEKRR